jgi:hypothetical protein
LYVISDQIMETENRKSSSVDPVVLIGLFLGMLYGFHQNYLEFVLPRAKASDGWFGNILSTLVYTFGDMLLLGLTWIDKLVYNAKFHAQVAEWTYTMHPNGDMLAFGSLIVLICMATGQILEWFSGK